MKVLIVGDLISKPGRKVLKRYLSKNKSKYDFIVINGENSAGGFGITENIAESFFNSGVDIITTGNHVWDQKKIYPYLDSTERILRPLNYVDTAPGHGSTVYSKKGKTLGVINLQGRIFMGELESPFLQIEDEIKRLKEETDCIIVDFHAETTSEKMAMGWFLDGKASVVYGTHTHVLTADNRILKKGTGYITDIGMSGGFDGIIGMQKEDIIQKFKDCLPTRFKVCKENIRLNGIEVEIDEETGKCSSIERLDVRLEDI
ncbi:MAG: TIGR00282 family metallophosphoesterase [Fusobacteriota bacterium]